MIILKGDKIKIGRQVIVVYETQVFAGKYLLLEKN